MRKPASLMASLVDNFVRRRDGHDEAGERAILDVRQDYVYVGFPCLRQAAGESTLPGLRRHQDGR